MHVHDWRKNERKKIETSRNEHDRDKSHANYFQINMS